MALPISRNRTYSVGSAVVAADLNDLQDQIIALRAVRPRKLPLWLGRVAGGLTGTFNDDQSFTHTGGAGTLRVPMLLRAGERIQSLRARVDPAATGTVSLILIRFTDLAGVNVGSFASSSGGAIQTIQTPAINEVVADDPRIAYVASFSFAVTTGHVVINADFLTDLP